MSQDSHPRKSILREPGKLGSKRALAPNKKFGKGRVHREELSQSARFMSVVVARQNSGKYHMRGPTKKDAPAKQHGIWRNIFASSRIRTKATFRTPVEAKVMPAPTSKRPAEREFVGDSGASTHMMSKKEISSEEMDTVKRSRNSTVVLTANGEVHTHEEAQVFVHDLNLFVTVQFFKETLAVLSLGKLCEDHGYSNEWVSGQKPRLTKGGKSIICETDNFVPPDVPGLSTNSESIPSSTSPQDSVRREAEMASRKLVRSPENPQQKKERIDKTNSDDPLADLPEWLEEFRENLVHTELPASAHSSRTSYESCNEIKDAQFLYSLPKNRNCDVCVRTKMTRLLAQDALAKLYFVQKNMVT